MAGRTLVARFLLIAFFMISISDPAPARAEAETIMPVAVPYPGRTVQLLPGDEALLDEIQERSFAYFREEVNPKNGLVPDRAHNFRKGATASPASIAAVGFALTAYPVGVERGWMDYATAFELTRRTLDFFLHQVPHERGFFYHFLDMQTGERARRSELSPIDTALFLAGALYAAEYFNHETLRDMADQLYHRVDWKWMLNGGETFAMAWSPERGFERYRWNDYNESMIMYLLAMASPTHPIPAESWKVIRRPVGSYGKHRLIAMPPLFTHQYSHIWVDFRNKHDGFADYFRNSIEAARANRLFCIDQASNFKTYGHNAWGLTASDGPFGYRAYGAPPGWADHDGTLAPTGCGASIPFTPSESIACLKHYRENLSDRLWGMYGFSDAFNLDRDWFDEEVIAIDQGALLLMIENFRSERIWNVMMQNAAIQKGLELANFQPGTKELPWPEPPVYQVPYVAGGFRIDGYLRDWAHSHAILLKPDMREFGHVQDEKDLNGEIRFAWDEEALYFSAKVRDSDVIVRKTAKHIWKDDALEFFIDPDGDGLYWDDEQDFQIGFRAEEGTGGSLAWSWFGREHNPIEEGMAAVRSFVDGDGYILEGAIRWEYLGLQPSAGDAIHLSTAVHDIDRDRSEAKLQWHFRNEGEWKRFSLGQLILGAAE